ncbi:hypothetical protein TSUD_410870, partial [Trifolium subterraneum]
MSKSIVNVMTSRNGSKAYKGYVLLSLFMVGHLEHEELLPSGLGLNAQRVEDIHFWAVEQGPKHEVQVHNPPPGLLGQNTTTTAVHRRLVDSDQGKDQWRRLWGLKFPQSFPRIRPKLTTKNPFLDQMAGANHANHEFVGENHPNPPTHQNQSDGVETSVTPEGSAAHAQTTPPNVPPPHQPPQPEDPLVVPQVPQGAPMEVVMAA